MGWIQRQRLPAHQFAVPEHVSGQNFHRSPLTSPSPAALHKQDRVTCDFHVHPCTPLITKPFQNSTGMSVYSLAQEHGFTCSINRKHLVAATSALFTAPCFSSFQHSMTEPYLLYALSPALKRSTIDCPALVTSTQPRAHTSGPSPPTCLNHPLHKTNTSPHCPAPSPVQAVNHKP